MLRVLQIFLVYLILFFHTSFKSLENFNETIKEVDRIFFPETIIKYLPEQCYSFKNGPFKVQADQNTKIVWHWDSQSNRRRNPYLTYKFLKGRSKIGQPVATHFVVSPKLILQMLPMAESFFQQGRLTNDLKTDNGFEAPSRNTINIETTGKNYDKHKPPWSQTKRLLKLTISLMKQYNIDFSRVKGHLEISPFIKRRDPGIRFLRKTRVRLLKMLIKKKLDHLIGKPSHWRFDRQFVRKNTVYSSISQSSKSILRKLSKSEKEFLTSIL